MSNTNSNLITLIDKKFTNWSNTFSCIPKNTYFPKDDTQLITILKIAKDLRLKVRVVGSGMSPSDLVLTSDILISLRYLNKIIEVVDKEKCLVRVQSGITLKQLCQELDSLGYALNNLGSISEQTLGGAIGTGIHGSGLNYGILSTHVKKVTFITSEGEVRSVSEDDEDKDLFNALLCNLGCLGIITEFVLELEPKYDLRSVQYPLSLNYILNNYNELLNTGEHVRFWWFPHVLPKPHNCFIWKASRISERDPSLDLVNSQSWLSSVIERFIRVNVYEFSLYLSSYFPSLVPYINTFYFRTYFDKTYIKEGSMHEVFTFDCLFSQFVSEWSIPIRNTKRALEALEIFFNNDKINFKAHFPIEIRFTKNDDILLSNAYGDEPVCYIGIISYRPFGKFIEHKPYWDKFEEIMQNLEGRPHWAKAHPLSKLDLAKIYPKFDNFLKIREALDPSNMFVNDYIKRHLLN